MYIKYPRPNLNEEDLRKIIVNSKSVLYITEETKNDINDILLTDNLCVSFSYRSMKDLMICPSKLEFGEYDKNYDEAMNNYLEKIKK